MKKILTVLLIVTMILSLSACDGDSTESNYSDGNNNTTTTQSNIEKELTDIEMDLGKIANDYLNFDITDEETETKLDVLDARSEILYEKINAACEEFYKSDRFSKTDHDANFEQQEMVSQKRYFAVSTDINSFRLALRSTGDKNDIVKIRDEYYDYQTNA